MRVPDGTVRITLEGVERAKISAYTQTDPFFKARVRILTSPARGEAKVEALMRSIISLFDQVVQNQTGYNGRPIPPELLMTVVNIDDPSKLADTIVPHLPLKAEVKQDMLETVECDRAPRKTQSAAAERNGGP